MKNIVTHRYTEGKYRKKKVLLKLIFQKRFRKKLPLREMHYQEILKKSPIPKKPATEFLKSRSEILLEDFFSRNGNLSPHELMILTAVVKENKPKRLLEIGTFDGNTTLQMACNIPEEAVVHTIDLPQELSVTVRPTLDSDLKFIKDEQKQKRKFLGTRVENKIRQHFGDSTAYDFSRFEGPLDFIFIDGGHSYECVKSDTENALKVLGERGTILWHDFTPLFDGVFQFLCELSQKLPLTHIEGTNLVLYQKGEK